MKNLFGQEPYALRGENDAGLADLVTDVSALDTRLDVLEAASRPLGKLGSASATANQGSITTQVAITGLSTAVTVAANRSIRVYAEMYFQNDTVNVTAGARMFLQQDGGQIQQADHRLTAANIPEKFITSWVGTPSAGAHTFRVTADNAGGGTVTMVAGATFPAYIVVEDIGAS